MKVFVAVLCLALVATNQAFFTDTIDSLVNTVKENVLPTLVNVGLSALLGAVGKRDVEAESLVLLEDAVTDKAEQKSQLQSFLQKLGEARKAGNVQQFLQNHLKEQREKYLQRLTPEMRQKYEERAKKLKEAQEAHAKKMAEYKKKMEACQAAVKTAKEAAAKTADKTDGSPRDLYKVYVDCLRAAGKKTEETKTQEDSSSFRDSLEKFRQQFLEAKKNGKLAEFLKTHSANVKSKLEALHKQRLAKLTDEQKKMLEAYKQSINSLAAAAKACHSKATAAKDASVLETARAFASCMTQSTKTSETKTQEDAPQTTAAERAEFKKKFEEAKKAGNVREFLQKHHEELLKKLSEARQAYIAKVKTCQTQVETAKKAAPEPAKFDVREAMRYCLMTEEQRKMEEMKKKCYAEAKAKKEEADKAKTQFSRGDFYKAVRECMMPEDKKTQEDVHIHGDHVHGVPKALLQDFMKKYEEAKKAGNVKAFLENYNKKLHEMEEACEKKVKAAMAALSPAEKRKYDIRKEFEECMGGADPNHHD